MLHRFFYLLAGLLTFAGAGRLADGNDLGYISLLGGLAWFFNAYVQEHKYHISIFNRFLAQQQNQKPPS